MRKNPNVERGPNDTIAIKQPKPTITAGVRQLVAADAAALDIAAFDAANSLVAFGDGLVIDGSGYKGSRDAPL